MDDFAVSGMAWWNGLSELARIVALAAAGPTASVADAYRHYLAKLAENRAEGHEASRGSPHENS